MATVYATAINVTAATNATEAVLTATNTYAVGDLVEYVGGWSRASGRIFRVKAASGTTVTLEALDTTSVTLFPAAGGVGTLREITTWTPITQVLTCTSSGGEPQYVSYSFMDQDFETQIPSSTSAQSLAMEIADDPSLPHYAALKTASTTRAPTAMRGVLPSGSILLYNGIFAFDETPSMTKGQVMAVKAGYALQGKPVRYAS